MKKYNEIRIATTTICLCALALLLIGNYYLHLELGKHLMQFFVNHSFITALLFVAVLWKVFYVLLVIANNVIELFEYVASVITGEKIKAD